MIDETLVLGAVPASGAADRPCFPAGVRSQTARFLFARLLRPDTSQQLPSRPQREFSARHRVALRLHEIEWPSTFSTGQSETPPAPRPPRRSDQLRSHLDGSIDTGPSPPAWKPAQRAEISGALLQRIWPPPPPRRRNTKGATTGGAALKRYFFLAPSILMTITRDSFQPLQCRSCVSCILGYDAKVNKKSTHRVLPPPQEKPFQQHDAVIHAASRRVLAGKNHHAPVSHPSNDGN